MTFFSGINGDGLTPFAVDPFSLELIEAAALIPGVGEAMESKEASK